MIARPGFRLMEHGKRYYDRRRAGTDQRIYQHRSQLAVSQESNDQAYSRHVRQHEGRNEKSDRPMSATQPVVSAEQEPRQRSLPQWFCDAIHLS